MAEPPRSDRTDEMFGPPQLNSTARAYKVCAWRCQSEVSKLLYSITVIVRVFVMYELGFAQPNNRLYVIGIGR